MSFTCRVVQYCVHSSAWPPYEIVMAYNHDADVMWEHIKLIEASIMKERLNVARKEMF